MSVYKRKNSPYYYYDFTIKGRVYTGSTKSRNKAKAQQIETYQRQQVLDNLLLGQKFDITLDDAITLFLKTDKTARANTNTNKLRGFIRNPRTNRKIKIAGMDIQMPLTDLTTKIVLDHYDKRIAEGYQPGTIKQELHILKKVIDNAGERGFKTPKIKFPTINTGKGRLRFLTHNEEKRLLEECKSARGGQLYDFVVMLLDTGCRYQEMAHLSWANVDLDAGEIIVWRSKTEREDVIRLTNRAKAVLAERFGRRENDEYVFTNKQRTSHRGYSSVAFDAAVERAGLNTEAMIKQKGSKIVFHSLRHTFASRLIQRGLSLYEVKDLLGQKDLASAMIYSHLVPADVRNKAVGVLDEIHRV